MNHEMQHRYGAHVHLFDNPFLHGLLAQLCSPETFQPQINHLVEILYNHLITTVMNNEFPREKFKTATRMTNAHPQIHLTGERLLHHQRVICVNIARAGTYPSHVCFNALHYALHHEHLRQDHIFAARAVDGQNQVIGTEIGATKIGGDKEKSIILFPDPMGATGNTLIAAVDHYKKNVSGQAMKMIALHLIVTPEYIKKVSQQHPDLLIYALRLDRGLSRSDVLATTPGTHWEQERGLNDHDYIVPGGGGFGEIMNNSFV